MFDVRPHREDGDSPERDNKNFTVEDLRRLSRLVVESGNEISCGKEKSLELNPTYQIFFEYIDGGKGDVLLQALPRHLDGLSASERGVVVAWAKSAELLSPHEFADVLTNFEDAFVRLGEHWRSAQSLPEPLKDDIIRILECQAGRLLVMLIINENCGWTDAPNARVALETNLINLAARDKTFAANAKWVLSDWDERIDRARQAVKEEAIEVCGPMQGTEQDIFPQSSSESILEEAGQQQQFEHLVREIEEIIRPPNKEAGWYHPVEELAALMERSRETIVIDPNFRTDRGIEGTLYLLKGIALSRPGLTIEIGADCRWLDSISDILKTESPLKNPELLRARVVEFLNSPTGAPSAFFDFVTEDGVACRSLRKLRELGLKFSCEGPATPGSALAFDEPFKPNSVPWAKAEDVHCDGSLNSFEYTRIFRQAAHNVSLKKGAGPYGIVAVAGEQLKQLVEHMILKCGAVSSQVPNYLYRSGPSAEVEPRDLMLLSTEADGDEETDAPEEETVDSNSDSPVLVS